MITILLFIVILGILVVVHEWGHYITARMNGMKVYEFGFGFPPRVLSFYRDPETKKIVWVFGKSKRGTGNGERGTEGGSLKKTVSGDDQGSEYPGMLWSINLLPIGGFVRIKGENGEHAKDSDSFGSKKAWQRVVVLVAGVTMNFIFAGVVLGLGFMIGLPADLSYGVDKHAQIIEEASVIVQQVQSDTPAEMAGINFGDKIIGFDDVDVSSITEMNEYIDAHADVEIVAHILRGEENLELALMPKIFEGDADASIGVAVAEAGIIKYPWYIAIYKGFVAAVFGLMNIFVAFYYLIKNLIIGQGLLFEVAGPVGIANIVGQSAKLGFNYILNVTAMLSLSLAAINILPIPALDGGRVLFILIEKIIRRPVPMKYEQFAHMIGFALLMVLIVVVTWRDIVGLF